MNTQFKVSEINVSGKIYHRLLVPKKVSNLLNIEHGDKVNLTLHRINRDGEVIWRSRNDSNASLERDEGIDE